MSDPIQLVVFDMAGTTVAEHDQVHTALQHALAQENIHISYEEANAVMGHPKPAAIRRLLQEKLTNPAQITEEYIAQIHQSFVDKMVHHYQSSPTVAEKEGVRSTWEGLRNHGISIALDTGFSRLIANAIIDRLGWRSLIDTSVTSDEVAQGRPYPDMIFKAMEQVGVTSADLVAKVGDTSSDMQQGTRAGCRFVVGVTSGAYSKEALQQEPHTHLIQQLPELLPVLSIA